MGPCPVPESSDTRRRWPTDGMPIPMPSYDNGTHGCLKYCLNGIPVGPGWSSHPQCRADCGGRHTRNCRTPRGERWQDGARRRCCHHHHHPPRGGSSRSRWWDRRGQIRPLLLKKSAAPWCLFNLVLANINIFPTVSLISRINLTTMYPV